jgi:hypothetical protein
MKQQIIIIVNILVILSVYYQQAYAISEPQIQQGKMALFNSWNSVPIIRSSAVVGGFYAK